MIFLQVIGKNAPAFTVASLATTIAGRPSIVPRVVTTPAAGPAVLAVHPVGGEEPAFEPGRSGVEQVFEAFPGGEASVPVLPLDALGATALLESGGLLEQVRPGLGKGRGGEIDGRPGLAHERARILPPRHRVRRAPPQPTSRSRSDPGREGWTASFARL